jgi:hypothetical protein
VLQAENRNSKHSAHVPKEEIGSTNNRIQGLSSKTETIDKEAVVTAGDCGTFQQTKLQKIRQT